MYRVFTVNDRFLEGIDSKINLQSTLYHIWRKGSVILWF